MNRILINAFRAILIEIDFNQSHPHHPQHNIIAHLHSYSCAIALTIAYSLLHRLVILRV